MTARAPWDVTDRFALITGSSRGIGRAIADTLAGAGCNVALSSRNLRECRAAADEIGAVHRVRALGLEADISSRASVGQMFVRLREWSENRLDILVCNAGYPFQPALWNTPLHATPDAGLPEWYLETFRTDALGSVFCTFEALPLMQARRNGSLIYIASTPALEGYQGSPYTMAKAAVLGLMRDVAREYGRDNIRANALALGNISTPATYASLDEDSRRALAAESPLGRWGTPEEVGRAALFLASDLSSFVSGQVLVVDGGTLRR